MLQHAPGFENLVGASKVPWQTHVVLLQSRLVNGRGNCARNQIKITLKHVIQHKANPTTYDEVAKSLPTADPLAQSGGKPFKNIASYSKMLPSRGPTPLRQKVSGWF